jgi:hypothetical protein
MPMMMRPPSLLHRDDNDDETEERRRRTMKERDLAGTDELLPLEASLAGLGVGALWAAGTGGKLLRRTIMAPLLPESMGYACLAGAVTGALAATGLWQARRTVRNWDIYHQFVFPGASSIASLL